MPLSLPLFLSFRYLFSGQRGYLSLISWFSLVGMALGVASLIIVTSVMNGFEHQLQQRILNVVPHVYAQTTGQLRLDELETVLQQDPRVVGIAPYAKTQAMLTFGDHLSGVVLNGVEPDSLRDVSLIPASTVVGSVDQLQAKSFNIVIGSGIARSLGLYVGDKVTVVLPKVSVSPAGAFPRSKRFTIVGIFQAGAQVDESETYIHLADYQRLLAIKNEDHGFRIQLNDVLSAAVYAQIKSRQLGEAAILQDWSFTHGGLFQAVKVEKVMVAGWLSIIVLVAAFNVVAVLTMMVMNKRSAIAVLRTIGASQQLVTSTFIVQGVMLGSVGTVVGVSLGLPIALHLTAMMDWAGLTLFDADIYYIASLPSVVNAVHIAFIIGFALLISLLATLYPAYRAAQIHPSEVLRYE